jgi:hypothetical protein
MDDIKELLRRIDSLADAHVKNFSETLDTQATVNVILDCVKTLMIARGVSMRHESLLERAALKAQLDSECQDAYKFYRSEASKRVAFEDSLLADTPSEHEH